LELVKKARNNVRVTDSIGRYGGEEFLIVLPETNLSNAVIVVENLRILISNSEYESIHKITISCGVASINDKNDTIEKNVKEAEYR
jgi:diguanylate cyclase (GGDEF)-like protein